MSHKSQSNIDLTEPSDPLAPPSQEHRLHEETITLGAHYYNDATDNEEMYIPSQISGWSLEMIGLILTLAAFISLLAVLKKVDNQPLSTWQFPFSVNTVVSSLSIIIKTPLAFAVGSCIGQAKWSWFTKRSGPLSGFVTFDDASRGPLGCVALLWWLKSRHWASLGAWVTLLLLGVDPFWQAVIQYDGKLVSTGFDDSSILTSQKLNVGDWHYENGAEVVDYYGSDDVYQEYRLYPDIGISATLLIAVVNSSASSSTQPPSISCRTGNCTWPLYTSLGIFNKEQSLGMPDESVFSSCHDSSFTFTKNYTSYVVPYPGGRRVILQNFDGYVDDAECELRSRVGLSAAFQPSDTYSFKKSQTLLASFALLELSTDYWNNETPIEKATPKATECALEFCALAYETQMKNGLPTESIVSKSTARVNNSYSRSGNLTMLNGVIPRYDLQVTLSDDTDPKTSPRIFNVTQKSIVTMASNLYQNATLESITYAISNTTNVTQTFDNAARLLTYRMREIDGSKALGVSEQWVVFIHVRWEFIIFPVIALISGYIFAIGAVIDSNRLELKTMKSDTIASLLWGLDSGTRQYLRFEEQQYNSYSDKFMVKLTTEVDGLQLRAL
ncbi:hypothetical protein F4782DRAFT_546401 [Xylaria castorea]|nr:hypothetical protein F4782DRAFT_546401 [Xylaria castorea]